MGSYLSAPVTDKESFDESCKEFNYGASSMQGWRTEQEVCFFVFFLAGRLRYQDLESRCISRLQYHCHNDNHCDDIQNRDLAIQVLVLQFYLYSSRSSHLDLDQIQIIIQFVDLDSRSRYQRSLDLDTNINQI